MQVHLISSKHRGEFSALKSLGTVILFVPRELMNDPIALVITYHYSPCRVSSATSTSTR